MNSAYAKKEIAYALGFTINSSWGHLGLQLMHLGDTWVYS